MVVSVEALESVIDPRTRFERAREAKAAADAAFDRVAAAAAQELVAAHNGNLNAAARELGLTNNGLKKIITTKAVAGAQPNRVAAVQSQPALRFVDVDHARDALADWVLRRQDVSDTEESLFLGALAVGMDPLDMHEQAGVGLDRLRRIRPAGNIAVSALDSGDLDLLAAFARRMIEHGQHLAAVAAEPGGIPAQTVAARIWQHSAHLIALNIAEEVLLPASTVDVADFGDLGREENLAAWMRAVEEEARSQPVTNAARPDELAAIAGPDAWLARLHLSFLRQATQAPLSADDTDLAAFELTRAVYAALAAAIDHLRRTATLPTLEAQT